ncbi:transporter [Geobacter grbiciae]|uniref:transporter n=1 Tax=Geobacter grbiciae TaxID=155042 RepID=UPI001C028FD5|nr:transporter [Geobacter grbiciae]MBT1074571.1 transporter [Geobacter grbiciae]
MTMNYAKRLAYVLMPLTLAAPAGALGEEMPTEARQELVKLSRILEEQSRQLLEQKHALEEQEARFREYRTSVDQRLSEQQRRIDELQARVSSLAPAAPSARSEAAQPVKVTTVQSLMEQRAAGPNDAASPSPAPTTPQQPVGIPPEQPKEQRPPEIAPIFEQPGVLTPRGTLVFEPSFQYSHSSTNRLALVGYTIVPAVHVGIIDIRGVDRDAYIGALAARYGLTNRLEFEVKVPYVYRTDTSTTRSYISSGLTDTAFDSDGNGIGDVEFGLRYQINSPTTGPFFISSLRVKTDTGTGPFDIPYEQRLLKDNPDPTPDQYSFVPGEQPTGSGFWGVQFGLSAIYPTDPAVLFGGISYLWNIERDVDGTVGGRQLGIGSYDPGDAIGFNFGMGLALNESVSFSLGYDHSIIGKNKQDGVSVGDTETHVGTLLFGYSLRLGSNTTANLSLGIGVTEAAPDVQLTLRVPINF